MKYDITVTIGEARIVYNEYLCRVEADSEEEAKNLAAGGTVEMEFIRWVSDADLDGEGEFEIENIKVVE